MSINSMTGFSRAEGSCGLTRWAWEVRTVNGRNLDLRLRLPPGFEHLEPRVREVVGSRFQRGSVQVSLNVKRDEGLTRIQLNEPALVQAMAATRRACELTGTPAPPIDTLLAIKGVIEVIEANESEAEAEAKTSRMLASLRQACDGVGEARRDEGRRLQQVLLDQVAEIERIADNLENHPSRDVAAVKRRLAEQVRKLVDAASAFDAQRLHQEAILLASKADIEEEIKRVQVHVAAARQLLGAQDAVGRKLDFLSQEFNREANTICSKANDSGVTALGLSLKAVIEQFREQLQNIE